MQKVPDDNKELGGHLCQHYQESLLFPLNDIFPKLFFLKELDQCWLNLFYNLKNSDSSIKWNENLNTQKLEILLKSSKHYLDHNEKEAIFVYQLRNFFSDIKYSHIGLKEIVSQCKVLLDFAQQWEKSDSKEVSAIRSLGQSYLLFFLTLNSSSYGPIHQRKILTLSLEYGQRAKRELMHSDHPYFGLLFCLLRIAQGNWNLATKHLHSTALKYPAPLLFKALSKLYIKIGLPSVAKYFENKLNHSPDESVLNSDFSPLANCA